MGEDRLHKCVIAVYEKFHSLEFDKPTSLSYFKAKDVELLKNILDMFQEESIDQKDQLLFLRNSSTIMKIKPKEKGVLII